MTAPQNLDAERSVLGAILLDNDSFSAAARLKPSDFYRDAHQRTFAAMSTLLERAGGAADLTTLVAELQRRGDLDEVGGAVFLAGLTDGMPRTSNVKHYASLVLEEARARRLLKLATMITTATHEQDGTVDEIIDNADSALLALRENRDGEALPLSKATSALMRDLEYRVAHAGQLTGLDTGFKSLNEMTFGWQPGDLIIVAARPSMGKTALVLKTLLCGTEAPRSDGSPRQSLVFSMEMTKEQLQYRLLSSLSGIPAQRLNAGILGPAGSVDWKLLAEATERMHNLGIHIDDRSGLTVTQVRAAARRLYKAGGLDLIVIDYVQLMASVLEKRGASRTEELSDTSRKLKTLAKELNVPIVLVSQLRRISGRPKLDDLRECGSLEQDADIVGFLHRRNHKEDGPTEFILEKNRNGPTGTTVFTFTKTTVDFVDGGDPPPAEEQADEERQARRTKQRGHFARRAAGH